MSFFDRVTKGDIEDIRHAVELLDRRTERVQKSQRSAYAHIASLSRRLKRIEAMIASAPVESEVQVEEEDEELVDDAFSRENGKPEVLLDRDAQRRALGMQFNGQSS